MRVLMILCLLTTFAFADDDFADDDPDIWPEATRVRAKPQTCAPCDEHLPPIARVVDAAYRAAGLDSTPTDSWVRRARWSALIPWISARAARNQSWDDGDPMIGHSLTYEVRATWRLDRLAFDGRELQVASIDAARRRERRRLSTRVIRVYFTWLRAHRAGEDLIEAESAAELDALTDGAFAKLLHH